MTTPLDNLAHLRLHNLARHRAQTLRREAITDFWRSADAALTSTLGNVCRSAQRLAWRLARHAQGRAADTTPSRSGDETCPR